MPVSKQELFDSGRDGALTEDTAAPRTSAGGEGSEAADLGDLSSTPAKKRKARIVHKIPGRIRMRIPRAKTNPEVLETYKEIFSAIPGITKVKAKPESGSIIIHYDPKQEAEFEKQLPIASARHQLSIAALKPGDEIDALATKIKAQAEFLAERSELAATTVDFFRNLNDQLKVATGHTIDLKILLAGGLAVYTFWEMGPNAATPIWATLTLFSLNHLAELQSGSPAAAPSRAG
jgi:Heavy metal associated domain 2